MTKTQRAEQIIQELFEQQGIAELYNEIDDSEMHNVIKAFTNNRITEQQFKEKVLDLVLGYKALNEQLEEIEMFERNMLIGERALKNVMTVYLMDDEDFYQKNRLAIIENMNILEEYKTEEQELYELYYYWIEDWVIEYLDVPILVVFK